MDETPAKLPTWVSNQEGLPTDNLTHVADADHLKVFASRNDKDDWCVLLALEPTTKGSDGAVGASCAPAERFASNGVAVEVVGPSARRGNALLVPDDFSGDIDDRWEQVNDNLAVRQ